MIFGFRIDILPLPSLSYNNDLSRRKSKNHKKRLNFNKLKKQNVVIYVLKCKFYITILCTDLTKKLNIDLESS